MVRLLVIVVLAIFLFKGPLALLVGLLLLGYAGMVLKMFFGKTPPLGP